MKRIRDERGFIGGLEGLIFGVLIFFCGTLVIAYGWSVVNAKIAATSAAREASRAYVEAPTAAQAVSSAEISANAALSTYIQKDIESSVEINQSKSWQRCAPVEIVVRIKVHRIAIPLLNRSAGTTEITGRHSEIVDPYRSASALEGPANC